MTIFDGIYAMYRTARLPIRPAPWPGTPGTPRTSSRRPGSGPVRAGLRRPEAARERGQGLARSPSPPTPTRTRSGRSGVRRLFLRERTKVHGRTDRPTPTRAGTARDGRRRDDGRPVGHQDLPPPGGRPPPRPGAARLRPQGHRGLQARGDRHACSASPRPTVRTLLHRAVKAAAPGAGRVQAPANGETNRSFEEGRS
ncbi:MAG: hypothetical protein M0C28_12130 [Candidatus Moduliflexus flocculans]|nr:hypothetical protein [Candidatus Moduliflexus flocculans]